MFGPYFSYWDTVLVLGFVVYVFVWAFKKTKAWSEARTAIKNQAQSSLEDLRSKILELEKALLDKSPEEPKDATK